MDILQKCQKWIQEEHFSKVIKALDGIEPNERTPEMDLQLALALTNQGARVKNGSHMIQRAIELLESHEQLLGKSFMWNFILGNAYFLLNEEGRALKYFECASEEDPDEFSSKSNIALCIKCLTMPVYERSYRARVLMACLSFADQEREIRRLLDNLDKEGYADRVLQKLSAIFLPVLPTKRIAVFPHILHYELVFSPDGGDYALHQLLFLKQQFKKIIKRHWNITLGTKASRDISYKRDGIELIGGDVKLWVTKEDDTLFNVSAYCPKLLQTRSENYALASWYLDNFIDIAIGEIANMRYIYDLDILDKPKSGKFIYLNELESTLRSKGCDLDISAEQYLASTFKLYNGKPDNNPYKIWREDICAGTTFVPELPECYVTGHNRLLDELHKQGICAGFIAFSLYNFIGSDRAEKILAFSEKFKDYLTKDGLGDVVKVVGTAVGLGYGYVDVMIWDLRPFLDAVYDFFNESDIEHVIFHSFRYKVGTVTIKQTQDDGQTHNFGINYVRSYQVQDTADKHAKSKRGKRNTKLIACDPTQPQAFYEQIEKLNTQNEYLKCITALESVDRQYWDYNHAYLLVRALQNYAIKGDRLQQTPIHKADEALLRSIMLLKEFKAKGKNDVRRFKYLALGYKSLYDQEERAITHAKKWASLDPDDESALKLIDECKATIAERSTPLIYKPNYAESKEDEDEGTDSKGLFFCCILLDKIGFDKAALIKNLETQWGIVCNTEEGDNSNHWVIKDKSSEALIVKQGKLFAIVGYNPRRLSENLEMAAYDNYMWEGAQAAPQNYKANITITIMGRKGDLMQRAKLFAKVTAACCSLKSASAVYINDVLVQKDFYINAASLIKENELPLDCWIWFGIHKTKKGYSAYTYGLEAFGKDELEVLDADCDPNQLRNFLFDVAENIIKNDLTFKDGDIIGFSAEDEHAITRSEGVALRGLQTLKIEY
ncbi:MAG: DUF4261 domain-containing protein [Anaerobiospirillum succiniciproducens]|uniref:DUF4261 domain-containing protein n=1 Tax=Anaerobiospirillum succiniciproducens TaxID=13335 RepID=UPI0026DBFB9F|nr:DUF4261 domain-containing protein [Anaerobiospirillum succiniciproducens]MDO4676157.1 DUF4261 domain-containing protein [Anaerobiospirillum succiniciproducens]